RNISNKSSLYPGVAVLINNRTDLNIPSRILNVLMHIPNTWPVQIIHSTSNYEYLIQSNDLKPYIDNGRIILTKLFDEKLFSLPNKLFTAIRFYELIPGEKILIFQLDSLFCSNSPHKITDYLQYDYIGAPWGITSKSGMVGNSGFSLRTRSKTIELLTNHPYDLSTNEDLWFASAPWGITSKSGMVGNSGFSLRTRSKTIELLTNHPYDLSTNEDLWFASNYHLVNANIPTTEIAATFSVETQYYPKPLGVHMPGNYLNMKDYTNLCIQCPELRMIWPYCQDKEKIPSAPWGITSKSGMVGNSGFSLRTRSKTIELLTNHPYDLSTNEDLWFASNYHLVNANIPTTEIAATFSVETQYYPKPLGVHMPGNYLNMKDYTNLCIQCPELRMIWPYCQDKEKIPSQEIMNDQQATTMNKTS
ncbi:unnamed protein product, partial [Adineta steineri]